MLTAPLLPFQAPAVPMMLDQGHLLLAMDPGLGKTIVSIAIAEELLGTGKIGGCLCVVPASLKYQWAQQLAQFTDLPRHDIKVGKELITVPKPPHCVVIDGNQGQRDNQYDQICGQTDYVILGYPNILNDWSLVNQQDWQLVVADEVTTWKNAGSDINQAFMEAFAQVPWRLGLTGTPVENKPEELFAIMEWIAPGYLGRPDHFDAAYVRRSSDGRVIRYRNLPVLHEKLAPVMFRKSRKDPDVSPYFPVVDEGSWLVPLTPELREVYRILAADLLKELRAIRKRSRGFDVAAAYRGAKPDESTAVGRIAARMQAMEMLTCHPKLILDSAIDYNISESARQRGEKKAQWPGSRYCADLAASHRITHEVHLATPKLDFLVNRCARILNEPGTRVLVYTKYTRMLPIIEDAMSVCQVGTVRYSGEMTAARKAGAIARFGNDPDCRVFVSSHAGAYGCDMYMATHLVNYDIPWSGGRAEQINGRHVRASNTSETIYIRHLLAENSLDERKLAQVRFKNRLAAAIVDGRGADRLGRIENDIGSLASFLEDLLAA